MEKTIQAFNVKSQQIETATIVFDSNNEFLVTFEDGTFIKMPGHFTALDIKGYLDIHEQENKKSEAELALAAQIKESENTLASL